MPDIDRVNLDNNTTYDIISKTGRGLVRATMNDSTSTSTAFVVTADSGIESLYDGLTIVCKNTKVASASGCTIDLNGLGAKRIWVSQGNGYCTTHWGLNATYIFIYDATNERWELQQGRDTNDNDTYTIRPYYTHFTSGVNGIKQYSLFARTSDGKYTSFTTNNGTGTKTFDTDTEFDISKIYYYNGSGNVAANTVLGSNTVTYCNIRTDLRYTFNGVTTSASTSSLIANKPVYLTFSSSNCTPGYAKLVSPYVCQDPTSYADSSRIFILVGYMEDSYRGDLLINNPAYTVNSFIENNETVYKYLPYFEGTSAFPLGENSHAEGFSTCASNSSSHAEGSITQASGSSSHAENYNTAARGFCSHASGQYTEAYGISSYSEGLFTISGIVWDNINYSLSFKGYWVSGTSYSVGDYVNDSILHGSLRDEFFVCYVATDGTTKPVDDTEHWILLSDFITSTVDGTHAEGYATISSGNSSHSEGKYTRTFGDQSHAEGLGTIAAGDYQHTGGKYNVADSNSTYAEIIGNGTGDSSRSNARTLDWNGNESLLGNLKFMECDATSTEADYPVNMIEPGITWKEKGYGDKFEIKPHFRGFNDGNALLVNAATGEAGTDPDVETIAKLHAKTAGVDLIGTVPVINISTNTTDLTQADNGVSSNTYVGTYYQDANGKIMAKITGVAYTDGKTGIELYAKNFNTSGTDQGNNTLTLYTDKSGNKTVGVTAPQAWLDALTRTTPATVAPNVFNIIGRDGVSENNVRWFFINCNSSLNGFKLVIELPANNWCKYRIETIGTANFGLFHNELYVGTNGSAAIDQCGYRDLNGTFTTVSGCSAVPTTYLTWTADKSNRKLTSNMIPKYGMCMVMVQSSTAITNLVKITTVESN